jgi:hypothetical protein
VLEVVPLQNPAVDLDGEPARVEPELVEKAR